MHIVTIMHMFSLFRCIIFMLQFSKQGARHQCIYVQIQQTGVGGGECGSRWSESIPTPLFFAIEELNIFMTREGDPARARGWPRKLLLLQL